jgi:hypothetical protein
MGAYDSDPESDDGSVQKGAGEVTLGFPDGPCPASELDWHVSRIGGYPVRPTFTAMSIVISVFLSVVLNFFSNPLRVLCSSRIKT